MQRLEVNSTGGLLVLSLLLLLLLLPAAGLAAARLQGQVGVRVRWTSPDTRSTRDARRTPPFQVSGTASGRRRL